MNGNLYNLKIYVYFTIVIFPLAAIIALGLDPLFSWIGFGQTAKIILGTPSGIAVLTFILNFFDTHAWRWHIFKWIGVVSVPNLSGRWNGTIKSSHNGNSTVKAVLEIKQTFSRICVNLYTATSESHSTITGFLKDEADQFTLSYMYQNTPRAMAITTMSTQQGAATLKVLKKGKSLDGCYYNNGRERTTFGELKFEWAQKELSQSFS